jgi:hypothetical protein
MCGRFTNRAKTEQVKKEFKVEAKILISFNRLKLAKECIAYNDESKFQLLGFYN